MSRIEIHNKLHYIFLLLIAFTLPFGKFTPLFIGLLLVNWLVEGGLIKKLKAVVNSKLTVTFILLYAIHIIGLLYTANMKAGSFDLEVKMSILIFPILLSSKPLYKKEQDQIFMGFIIGLIYAAVYMLSRSFYIYMISGENTFFYINFSVLIHSSYMAMYMNLGVVWLLINVLKTDASKKIIGNFLSFLIIGLFVLIILLLSSKTGILLLLLIVFTAILYYVFAQKKYVFGIISSFGLIILLGFTYTQVPQVKARLDNFLLAFNSETKKETMNSTSVRMLIWESAQEIIKENPVIGVGTGDAKEELNKVYEKNGIVNASKLSYNAHNEFFQILVSLGAIGGVILLLNLFFPMYISFQKKNYIYLIFILIITFNFFTESMLETKAGVMFYAYFNALLCFVKPDREIK